MKGETWSRRLWGGGCIVKIVITKGGEVQFPYVILGGAGWGVKF